MHSDKREFLWHQSCSNHSGGITESHLTRSAWTHLVIRITSMSHQSTIMSRLILLYVLGLRFVLASGARAGTQASSSQDLASALQEHVLTFFRSACDPTCCGQPSVGRSGPLPCCTTCDNMLDGSALNLPFSLDLTSAGTKETNPFFALQPIKTKPLTDSGSLFNASNIHLMMICRCADNSLSPECCPAGFPLPFVGPPLMCGCDDGTNSTKCCDFEALFSGSATANRTQEQQPCSCQGSGFQRDCCTSSTPETPADSTPSVLTVCLCPDSTLSPECCPETFEPPRRRHRLGTTAISESTPFPNPIPTATPNSASLSQTSALGLRLTHDLCSCDDGSFAAGCCVASAINGTGERVCRCPDSTLSPECCPRFAIRSGTVLEKRCFCPASNTGKFSEECCGHDGDAVEAEDDEDVRCLCTNGNVSSDCCPASVNGLPESKTEAEESFDFAVPVVAIDGIPQKIQACICPDGSLTTKCPCAKASENNRKTEL